MKVDENGKKLLLVINLLRPLEVNNLLGSAKKAKTFKLETKTNVDMLISEMVSLN